jgi:hypothetical protein
MLFYYVKAMTFKALAGFKFMLIKNATDAAIRGKKRY